MSKTDLTHYSEYFPKANMGRSEIDQSKLDRFKLINFSVN